MGASLAATLSFLCFAMGLLIFVLGGGDRLAAGATLLGLVAESLAVALALADRRPHTRA